MRLEIVFIETWVFSHLNDRPGVDQIVAFIERENARSRLRRGQGYTFGRFLVYI